jgi:phosphate-selective porin
MMVRMQGILAALLAAFILVVPSTVRAADATQAEIDALKKDIEGLRRQLAGSSTAMPKTSVDRALEGKYGPNASVTTKNGQLKIGGLLQVWYTSFQNDNQGYFNDNVNTGVLDTNEASDNDSFRIRRAEIKFTMDIHENVTAVVLIDPAREATSFPGLPQNQGLIKRVNNVAPEFEAANGVGGSTAAVAAVQAGAGAVPRLLQDAYINYHGVVPHHDFTIGQFKPRNGEEGVRGSGELDFAERSMIGQMNDARDLGVSIHGCWWDDRLQYWVGAFDAAGNYLGSAGQFQNRSDDNDNKDINAAIMIRPLWKNETWGSLELGYSFEGGTHGEAGSRFPIDAPINGLNRVEHYAFKHGAWASYMPGGPVRGWWLRGEWQRISDNNAPASVLAIGNGDTDLDPNAGDGIGQQQGRTLSIQGWYFATGYKLADSCFADSAPSWLKPWEFTFRYETMQNLMLADLNNSQHTDVFATSVYTAGVNYYIKGHNAKIQANYNWVKEGTEGSVARGTRSVNNDNFVVNFQVAF